MKTLIVFPIAICIALTSCNKEASTFKNSTTQSIQIGNLNNISAAKHNGKTVQYSIADNRIIIENNEDFQLIMWALETQNLDVWEEENNFYSYRTAFKLDKKLKSLDYSKLDQNLIFDDRELATLMNTKGILQINPYYFKLIPETRTILVMNVNQKNKLLTLENATTGSDNIKEFSFDDDVWYCLENNIEPNLDFDEETTVNSFLKKCNEKKSFNKEVHKHGVDFLNTTTHINTSVIEKKRVSLYMWYSRSGIWEKVRCRYIASRRHTNPTYNLTDILSFNVFYLKAAYCFNERCGNTLIGTKYYTGSDVAYTIRSNKKALERYQSYVDLEIYYNPQVSPNVANQHTSLLLNNF